jgi:hypothetical protein
VLSLDWALRSGGRDGKVSPGGHALLIGANVAVVVGLLHVVDRPWVLYAIFAGLLVQAIIIGAALLIISEEIRYWDGLILDHQKLLPTISCVRTAGVLTIASVALVFLAGLLSQHLDQYGTPLFKVRTHFACGSTACQYLEYVLVCLHEMPIIGGVVQFAVERLRHDYQVVFATTPEALSFRIGLYIATGTWIVGVFRLLMQQWVDVDALCQALEESAGGEATTYLQMRAARAPGFMKRRMIHESVTHPDHVARRRYITSCYHAKTLTFPQTFIHHLGEQSEFNKDWGLNRVRLLIEQKHATFDPKFRAALLREICRQIRIGDHKPAIVAELWNIAGVLMSPLTDGELAAAKHQLLMVATERVTAANNYAASQKRLLDLCSEAQIKAFPQAFLYNLEDHSDDVKLYGLQLLSQQIARGMPIDAETIQKSLTIALRDRKNTAVKAALQDLRLLIRKKERPDAP